MDLLNGDTKDLTDYIDECTLNFDGKCTIQETRELSKLKDKLNVFINGNNIERENAGYKIIESYKYRVITEKTSQGVVTDEKEIVIGYKPKAASEYVCWFCSGGKDYYWGVYTNSLAKAHDKAMERLSSETHMPYYYPRPIEDEAESENKLDENDEFSKEVDRYLEDNITEEDLEL